MREAKLTRRRLARPCVQVYDLMQSKPSIDPDVGLVPEGRARGHITFETVEFAYPGRQAARVLKGASFEVQPGQVRKGQRWASLSEPSTHHDLPSRGSLTSGAARALRCSV